LKRVTAALSTALLIILLPGAALGANPVQGAKCSKAGLSQTYLNLKFTCIKSGNKLIWSKSSLKPSPKPSPKPATTTLPSPISTTENKTEKAPTTATSATPTSSPTAIPDWRKTQIKLLEDLQSRKPTVVQKLNFILSPNANKVTASKLESAYQEPITLLSNLFVNPSPVTFLVMNESDHDWWVDQVKSLNSNQDLGWWNGSHCSVSVFVHCGYGSTPNPDGSFHFGQLLGSKFEWNTQDYVIAYHESIHVYQLGLMGNRMSFLPNWFAEGQANYLGATFVNRFRSTESVRDGEIRNLLNKLPELKNYKLQDWVTFLEKIDSDSNYVFQAGLGYSIGMLLLEDIYNKFNYEAVQNWMLDIKSGNSYKDAFEKVFKIKYQEWLTGSAAEHLSRQL
jgi:hypothetical protein